MTDFEYLKNCYIFSIRAGLAEKISYTECKIANEFIHKFCETYINNGEYDDKPGKKHELELLKEVLSHEIEAYYQHA